MIVLEGVNIYAISDTGFDHKVYFRELLTSGVDLIQLRDKGLSDKEFYELAFELKRLTSIYEKSFIINDRVEIALAVDADGVHLGKSDLPIDSARKILGDGKILGVTSHNFKEAEEAKIKGADYISVGPIFETSIKKGLRPIAYDEVVLIRNEINLPQVAIGGIALESIEHVKNMGFKNVAMIQALADSKDKKKLISKIRKVLNNDIDRKN
ncbi:MAG: thiamine phosphate synthase [Candidatus Saelkia tenebricola]|nr:thiamine phosphate synthase [Candidatus Saelkia tenebricola]